MKTGWLVVDGNNLGWRAFARTPLEWNGRRTEVSYIGLRQMITLLRKFNPEDVVVVWDGGRDKKRLDVFPEYKQDRRSLTPEEEAEKEEFYKQIRVFRRLLKKLGIKQLRCSGREADDVIYSLVLHVRILRGRTDVVIVSTDKDFYQMLDMKAVHLYSPTKKKFITCEEAEEEIGVELKYYAMWKVLVGGHDNLPGLKGVGPKKAALLIRSQVLGENVSGLSDSLIEDFQSKWSRLIILETEVARFQLVSYSEIQKGLDVPPVPTFSEWMQGVRQEFERLGFVSLLDNFADSLVPFIELHRRQGAFAKNGERKNSV